MLARKVAAFFYKLPLMGGSSSKLKVQAKKGFCSPTTMTLDRQGSAFLISFSIKTGGTFSPPAVIMSSFALPVMKSNPSLLSFPRSPEWT